MPAVWRRLVALVVACSVLLTLGVVAGEVNARYAAAAGNPTSSWTAATLYPGVRTTIASDATAAVNTLITSTKNLPMPFNTGKYYDVTFGSPLPDGVAVSNVQMTLVFTGSEASRTRPARTSRPCATAT